ncbi:RNA-binding protein MEX3B-like [Limulus polyphemus]|uniref:RNA-binding protein MEX3B-like n=1 Tax=Limulus polyphemus TaxID=6850 RepID=A0ABM1C5M0_LIMPO|nr:RNA-binding protein MEX3B-like [Limulus polyphemus]
MPASLFPDMERGGGGLEDQRALQLALELSMLGLNENESLNPILESDGRKKKSQNTTECVPVPTSEHVAEIVGRQGCKIKALRAKTNTYIKTPVRGEEPVFVVTGRKEDVCLAKREILSAAEHFSQIRAQRKSMNGSLAPGPNSNIPGQTTIQVRVPYRVVGLVVGPKGATIKRIQQQTNTYIVTPSRDKEPVFEVTGLPENVESAKKEIEAHIAMRTGSIMDPCGSNDFHSNEVDQAFTGNLNLTNNLVSSLYKSEINDFGLFSHESNTLDISSQGSIFNFSTMNGTAKLTDFSSYTNGFSKSFGFYDPDEGLGESPTLDSQLVPPPLNTVWSEFGNSHTSTSFRNTSLANLSGCSNSMTSVSSGLTSFADSLLLDHPPARRIRSDPSCVVPSLLALPNGNSNKAISNVTSSLASSPTDSFGSGGRRGKRECIICFESDIVAALVPCGHNLFCLECANRICEKPEAECPICHQSANQAIRIYC